jgi:hypothetical protein
MGYTTLGRMYVERHAPDEGEAVGTFEILEVDGASDTLWAEPLDDLDWVFNERNLPAEPGIYALSYVIDVSSHTDYWGEVDVDYDVVWSKVVRLSDEETKSLIEYIEFENGNITEDEHGQGN